MHRLRYRIRFFGVPRFFSGSGGQRHLNPQRCLWRRHCSRRLLGGGLTDGRELCSDLGSRDARLSMCGAVLIATQAARDPPARTLVYGGLWGVCHPGCRLDCLCGLGRWSNRNRLLHRRLPWLASSQDTRHPPPGALRCPGRLSGHSGLGRLGRLGSWRRPNDFGSRLHHCGELGGIRWGVRLLHRGGCGLFPAQDAGHAPPGALGSFHWCHLCRFRPFGHLACGRRSSLGTGHWLGLMDGSRLVGGGVDGLFPT